MAGLKWYRGKLIMKCMSLKVGEKLVREHATLFKKHSATALAMTFDELGQAATCDEKVGISYDISLNEDT